METRKSLDYKVRDQAVIRLCFNAVTIEDIQSEIGFDSYKTTARRVGVLAKRGSIKEVGSVLLKDTGRTNKVFCTQDIRPDRVRHELFLSKWLLKQEADFVVRYGDVDASLRPDAELHFEDGVLFVELDTGSEAHDQVRERMQVYDHCLQPVVWVCLTEKRMVAIKALCPYSHHLFSLWNVPNFL